MPQFTINAPDNMTEDQLRIALASQLPNIHLEVVSSTPDKLDDEVTVTIGYEQAMAAASVFAAAFPPESDGLLAQIPAIRDQFDVDLPHNDEGKFPDVTLTLNQETARMLSFLLDELGGNDPDVAEAAHTLLHQA